MALQVKGFGFWVSGFGMMDTNLLEIHPPHEGSGFRVQGSGFRVQGSGFRVQGGGAPHRKLMATPTSEKSC